MPFEIIYSFGDGPAEGNAETKDLLGGKGAGLAEMSNIGIPVAPRATTPAHRPDPDHPAAEQVRLPLHVRRLGGSDEVHRGPRPLPPEEVAGPGSTPHEAGPGATNGSRRSDAGVVARDPMELAFDLGSGDGNPIDLPRTPTDGHAAANGCRRHLDTDVPASSPPLPLPATAGGQGCDAGEGRGGDVVGRAWAELRTLLIRTGIKRHGLPVPDAEDLANETLATLIEKHDQLRKPGSVVPFAQQVLRRKAIDRHRRARRESSIEDAKGADGEDLVSGLPAGGPSPEDRAILRQRITAILEVIERIRASRANSERILAIFRRVLVEGHRECDVAREMGLSQGAVNLVIHRFRKLLRNAERAQEATHDEVGRRE